MTAMQASGSTRTALARLGDWWKKRCERAATVRRLRGLGDEELTHVAHDIGVSAGELAVLAGKWPDAAWSGVVPPRWD